MLQTVTVNQQLSPSGLLDQGTSWQQLGGDYTISGGTLVVRLSDQADPGGYLIADAVRIERVGGVVVANDSGTGFDSSPGWQSYAGAGYLTDMHFKQSGSGSETATWSFTGLAPGQYRVWTTWVPFSNRVTNAPYTILDGSMALQTVTVNQQLTPSGLLDQGTSWQQLGGDYTITGSTLVVRLSDQADPGGYLIADAVRIEQVGGASMSRPIAQLLAGSTVIADGTGVMDFGRTDPGVPLSQTFTMRNTGTSDLTLGTISLPAGFSLLSGYGATTLAPGATTTFSVQLDTSAAGSYAGTVSLATNDPLQDPFTFSVSGTVSEVQTLDDGEAGFASSARLAVLRWGRLPDRHALQAVWERVGNGDVELHGPGSGTVPGLDDLGALSPTG